MRGRLAHEIMLNVLAAMPSMDAVMQTVLALNPEGKLPEAALFATLHALHKYQISQQRGRLLLCTTAAHAAAFVQVVGG